MANIKDLTDYVLAQTTRLQVIPEVTPNCEAWSMFTDAGTEIEVSEFLYSVVRMVKPQLILETGTHIGVSSTYLALGLKRNKKGKLLTFEVIPQHHNNAQLLWKEVGVNEYIQGFLSDAGKFDATGMEFDILFLDSEPQFRFNEFLKFYPCLKPGGLIIIHDLHPSFGHHGQTYHGVYDWPYGDFREKIGPYIKNHEVQNISFPTPRGLTMFQKAAPGFEATNYLLGNL